MFGTSTPLALYATLLHARKEATTSIDDLQKAIDTSKKDGHFGAIQYHLSWHAASLLGEVTAARQADRWLSTTPAALQGKEERDAWSQDRDAINSDEEARKWWLSVLWDVSHHMTNRGRINPASRSTSVASNLAEDYETMFSAKIWEEAGAEGRYAIAEAELAQRERERQEYEENQKKAREERLLELERKEAEKKARREARKAARRA